MKRPSLSGDESEEVIAFVNAADAEIERLRAHREVLLTAAEPFAGAVYYAVQDLGHYRRAYDAVCAVQQTTQEK